MKFGGALLVLACCSACGTSTGGDPVSPTVRTLEWRDASGRPGRGMILHVQKLGVTRSGWYVTASVTNESGRALVVGRVHRLGGTTFGIAAVRDAPETAVLARIFATHFSPPLPRVLRTGATWSGVFSGRGHLARGHAYRVSFGTFFAVPTVQFGNRRFQHFDVITDEAVRLG